MRTSAGRAWATSDTVRERVRRRWDDGTLLRAVARGEEFVPLEIPLGGPRATEIGDRFAEVQTWMAELENGGRDGARYDLRLKTIGGRALGKNQIPSHALVSSVDQAWTLLGVHADVRTFREMVAAAPDERVTDWPLATPLVALRYAQEWPALLVAYAWLDASRGSGRYLRQIDAPGVDTKFVETRR